MARPCKLTAEVAGRICEAIQLGATYDLAAAHGGVDPSTLRRWLADERPEFQALQAALKGAEAAAVVVSLRRIHEAAAGGAWQASAWLLERRHPESYGRRRLEMSGPEGAPVDVAARVVLVPAMAANGDEWAAAVAAELR